MNYPRDLFGGELAVSLAAAGVWLHYSTPLAVGLCSETASTEVKKGSPSLALKQ
jgi:hypothetical protein